MSHNHNIVVAGSDTRTKQFATIFLEIPFCGNKYISIGIETKKLTPHLFGQVVGDNNQCFIAQPQALFSIAAAPITIVLPAPTEWATKVLPPNKILATALR